MRRINPPIALLTLTLALGLASPALATTDDPFDAPPASPEIVLAADAPAVAPSVSIDEAMPRYAPRDPGAEPKDPFNTLIEPPTPVVKSDKQDEKVIVRHEIPPLPLTVSFVVGNANSRLALLNLNGQPYEMRAGESEQGGLFKVLEISDSSVTVYDSRVQKNRVLAIGDKETAN